MKPSKSEIKQFTNKMLEDSPAMHVTSIIPGLESIAEQFYVPKGFQLDQFLMSKYPKHELSIDLQFDNKKQKVVSTEIKIFLDNNKLVNTYIGVYLD